MPTNNRILPKKIEQTRVISRRIHLTDRAQLPALFEELKRSIPEGQINGPPFCVLQFISSLTEGYDAEICFPVRGEAGDQSSLLPTLEVLSLIHSDPAQPLGTSYRTLYAWAAERGIISDEFCREVYLDHGEAGEVEIQFVVHPWHQLFDDHLARVLGADQASQISPGSGTLTPDSTLQDRYEWVLEGVRGLEAAAGDKECFEILSRCAHVFPSGQIARLRAVYLAAEEQSGDPMQAVDAVIEFMGEDPGWGEKPRREGNRIYSSKQPRDPAGYEKAESLEERRKAYCFCPLIREHLEESDLPACYCYCGAGWYRQQWEGALGRPVQVEIVRSLLRGDEVCEFAVVLPAA